MQKTALVRKGVGMLTGIVGLLASPLWAAELIHQEGFNTDGEPEGRYVMRGRDVYEVPRIQSVLGNFDQKGPLYWEHNFNVSFVGNPDIPARRVIWTWRTDPLGGAAGEDLLELFESTVNWLVQDKPNATIVVHPTAASINELAARLTAAGHNVVDDNIVTYPDEQAVPGDLFIHGPGSSNPSRFAMVAKPTIVMNEPDYDDMLVGSIGALATFDPGPVTIAAAGHPAAGGKTGTFTGFNLPAQPFGVVGSFLAPGATTVATVSRVIPPAVNNLADVDAMIAGTKQHETSTGTVADVDFSDGSAGNWPADHPIPGGYTGNWGLRVEGVLSVQEAGTYRMALGSDDGARLLIDLDRNGLTPEDTVLEDSGPHGHQNVYEDVTFESAGNYDFEVRAYNSGGGGSLELWASIDPVPVPDDALDSGYWDNVSTLGFGNVTLQGEANVTAYTAVGPDVEVQTPLIVALNGPNDTPPGSFYDGGAFTGFEGTGFIGASGLNKWPYPDGTTYRSLQLAPVNVAGKTDVHLTIALAATQVDFETSDFLDILVYTNGTSGTPITLAHFRGVQDAIQPWLADERENFVRRLTKRFADFTYSIPPGATELVVEIRAATTWWTEIAAFDNIRITAGAPAETPTISLAREGDDLVITFAGGTLERTSALDPEGATQWQEVTATGTFTLSPGEEQEPSGFFRVRQ
jgi:hypothetical protein